MTTILPILFAAVAFLYAMAGFGGGSTYTALLVISGIPLAAVPVISLTCNLVVTSQGSYLLARRKLIRWAVLTPLLATSMPCAFIGGAWRLPEASFIVILASALTVAGVAMLLRNRQAALTADSLKEPAKWQLALTGGLLGLLAGVTGIGGGIYLAPVMHLLRWSTAKNVTACTSLFIMLNSVTGLLGQLSKGSSELGTLSLWLILGCPVMVLLGGRIGSTQLAKKFSDTKIRAITATVILLVAVRLWIKIAFA